MISEQGVFAIETKTWRKPPGDARIRVRDGKLHRGDVPADPNPLEQAERQARWLADLLRESTGKIFPVRAVLLFPGWFIEPADRRAALPVWLLEPKALPGFLEHEVASVTPSDAAMAAYHLSRYVRTSA